MVDALPESLLVEESRLYDPNTVRSIRMAKAGSCRKVARPTEIGIPFLLLLRRGNLRIYAQSILLQVFQILP
jgi:hypothetical protein